MGLLEGIGSIFGGSDTDATAYAYQGSWSHLKIINLNIRKSKKVENKWVDFKAFVRSFRDSFNPGWQEVQYPNQSVPIAHQSMPKRTIQIEWTVPSTDAKEAILNLQKCSWLAQSMYPTLKQNQYSKGYTPKSTFMAIKFANLIQTNGGGPLPGYISSFSYTPNFTEGVHVLSRGAAPSALRKYFAQKKGKYLFPSLVDIAIEFKPIQTRDSFGLVDKLGAKLGWSNSSWPYGIQIDSKLHPVGPSSTKKKGEKKPGVEKDVETANKTGVYSITDYP